MNDSKIGVFFKSVSRFRKSKWFGVFVVCLLLGGFIVLTSEVQEALSGEAELIGTVDQITLSFLVKNRTPQLNAFAIDLTALGSGIVLTVLSIFICTLFLLTKRSITAVHFILSSVGAGILTWLLKFYFERSRPENALRLVDVQGYSYPSGHSLAAAAVYFTIAILVCKPLKDARARVALWTLFLSLITTIGGTRVYLGVHFFSDVLAGILIGIAWASLVEFIMNHFNEVGA